MLHPGLTPPQRASHAQRRGGPGVMKLVQEAGVWKVKRDIALGQGISNNVECSR